MKSSNPSTHQNRAISDQNESQNFLAVCGEVQNDSIRRWIEIYFEYEVTTSASSQKTQKRYLKLFHDFMVGEIGTDERLRWTPAFSRIFYDYLVLETVGGSKRRWNDRTVSNILTHIKTFSKWITQLCEHPDSPFRAFPFGDPMKKIRKPFSGNLMDVSRALTKKERQQLMNGADALVSVGGLSRDRKRFKAHQKPQRKDYRPYRNRAIIYLFIKTGMRRQALTNSMLSNFDLKKRKLTVVEKGRKTKTYTVPKEAVQAIQDYILKERDKDFRHWQSDFLFLPPSSAGRSKGSLTIRHINRIWSMVCEFSGVEDRTPHSARHAVGKHIIEKTGNIKAVQVALQHSSIVSSAVYTQPTIDELDEVLEDL